MQSNSICIVTGSLGSGGLERVTSLIANYYSNKNWSVSIICLLDNRKKRFVNLDKNVSVYYYPCKNSLNKVGKILSTFSWISFLKKAFKEIKPNCVLAMTLKIGALCSFSVPKRTRLTMREINDPMCSARSRVFDSFLFNLCRRVNSIIFQTEWEKSCYPKKLRLKGIVVPNPISVSCSSNNDYVKEIVTMGRLLNDQKKHDVLIKAFSLFINDFPEYRLKIYGEGPDYNDDVKLIKDLGLENSVILCGAEKQVHDLIKNSSIFVMSSEYEGLSNALIEAQLIGIPCITSDWNGANEIIEDNVNGLIFPRGDINDLALKMKTLIQNRNLMNSFSINGKQMKYKYEPNVVLEKYASIIEGENYERKI